MSKAIWNGVTIAESDDTIRPIAGTRPRGRDADEDAENKA